MNFCRSARLGLGLGLDLVTVLELPLVSALILLVGWQEGHLACKKWGMVEVGTDCLVRMEWRPDGWSVCLPLLIFPCTIKSRSSLLAPAHPGGPEKRAVKWLWCGGGARVVIGFLDWGKNVGFTDL